MVSATVGLSSPRLISDERLAQAVLSAVRRAGVRAVPGLRIVAEDGSINIKGTARSFYEKQLVLHAARHVPGVHTIVDELDVLPVGAT
jgi:osmotically-inducible protein OsmY